MQALNALRLVLGTMLDVDEDDDLDDIDDDDPLVGEHHLYDYLSWLLDWAVRALGEPRHAAGNMKQPTVPSPAVDTDARPDAVAHDFDDVRAARRRRRRGHGERFARLVGRGRRRR